MTIPETNHNYGRHQCVHGLDREWFENLASDMTALKTIGESNQKELSAIREALVGNENKEGLVAKVAVQTADIKSTRWQMRLQWGALGTLVTSLVVLGSLCYQHLQTLGEKINTALLKITTYMGP